MPEPDDAAATPKALRLPKVGVSISCRTPNLDLQKSWPSCPVVLDESHCFRYFTSKNEIGLCTMFLDEGHHFGYFGGRGRSRVGRVTIEALVYIHWYRGRGSDIRTPFSYRNHHFCRLPISNIGLCNKNLQNRWFW